MVLSNKVIFIALMHLFVPSLVAWLFIKIRRHESFIVGYLYSFVAAFVMISVLEGLGNSIVSRFIMSDKLSDEESFVYMLRICSLYFLASLGGSPIATYEALRTKART
jgi:hypothetical protein